MKIIKEYKDYRIISTASSWFDFNRNEYYYIEELKNKKFLFWSWKSWKDVDGNFSFSNIWTAEFALKELRKEKIKAFI